AMVIISDDIPILRAFIYKRGPGVEIIGKARAVKHTLVAQITNQRVAGRSANNWQVIVRGWKPPLGRPGRDLLLVVVAIKMDGQQQLALRVFTADAPGS